MTPYDTMVREAQQGYYTAESRLNRAIRGLVLALAKTGCRGLQESLAGSERWIDPCRFARFVYDFGDAVVADTEGYRAALAAAGKAIGNPRKQYDGPEVLATRAAEWNAAAEAVEAVVQRITPVGVVLLQSAETGIFVSAIHLRTGKTFSEYTSLAPVNGATLKMRVERKRPAWSKIG